LSAVWEVSYLNEKGGERHETFYDPKGCPLQPGLLSCVPGMTLNCPRLLWLFKLFVWFSSPFGVTQAYFDNHAWESVEHFFKETNSEQVYGGTLYISAGTAA
jgi:hypothetical protein